MTSRPTCIPSMRRAMKGTLVFALSLAAIAWGKSGPHHRVISYTVDSTPLQGHFFPSHAVKSPGKKALLLFPDWMGMTETADQYAQKWVREGFSVFVADIYGPKQTPQTMEEAAKISSFYKTNRSEMRTRAIAAWNAMKKLPGVDSTRIAAIGYCFGGTCALELARSGAAILGTISVHGSLDTPTPQDAKSISGKILVLHGGDDPYVPQEQVLNFMDEMRNAKLDWQFVHFGGAVHGFSNPNAPLDASKGFAFNPLAEKRSTDMIRIFTQEIFQANKFPRNSNSSR
jgi:dienelactone hydrolase